MGSISSPVLDREEYSFKAMWEQAQLRFQERTSRALKSGKGKSLEDVLRELEERYPEDNIFQAPSGSKSNVKDIVRNVLNCINILGGIVAQGASMVCILIISEPRSSPESDCQLTKIGVWRSCRHLLLCRLIPHRDARKDRSTLRRTCAAL